MGVSLSQVTPWGIVLIVVLAFVFGYIVPRTYLNDLQSIIDTLRQARDDERLARQKAEQQRDELLAHYAETTVKVISALPVPGGPDESGTASRSLDPGGDPNAMVA